MKKRILSLLLVLILLVTVSVFAVEANGDTPAANPFDSNESTVMAPCEACGGSEDVVWTRLDSVNDNGTLDLTPNGHFYVPSDRALSTTGTFSVVGKYCLYLNGTLTHESGATGQMFRYSTKTGDDSILNIMGSSTGRIVNLSTTKQIAICEVSRNENRNVFAIYSGTIDCYNNGTNFTQNGAALMANPSSGFTFEMHGGTIEGAKNTKTGGTIRMAGTGTFTMDGGTINGAASTSHQGGTVHIVGTSKSARANFTMSSGTIQGGSVTSNAAITAGGNLYLEYCNAEVSGDAKILNGTATGNTNSSGTTRVGQGGNISLKNGNLSISGSAEISGGTATSVGDVARGGNIYYIAGATDYTLNINGGKIVGGHTSTDAATNSLGGNLYIESGTSTMTNGTIESGYAVSNNAYNNGKAMGGNIYAKGAFTMTGGTIQKGTTPNARNACYGGNVYAADTFNLGGTGTIQFGNAVSGGNIYVLVGETVNVSGGTVYDGYATNGGNVFVAGTLSLSGGSITEGDISESSGAAGPDIYLRDHATSPKLIVTNGFTDEVHVYFAPTGMLNAETNVISDTVASASSNAESTTDNYTCGGKVFVTFADNANVEYLAMGDGDNLAVAEAAITDGSGFVSLYKTVAAAIEAAPAVVENGYATQYVQLWKSGVEINLTKPAIVDFNGYSATVNGAKGNLIGMDSKTNDYVDNTDSEVIINGDYDVINIAKLKIAGENVKRKYLALANEEGKGYSFHRYGLQTNAVGIRYKSTGPWLLYGANFYGDDAVADAINAEGNGYGIKFSWDGGSHAFNLANPTAEDNKLGLADEDAQPFVSGGMTNVKMGLGGFFDAAGEPVVQNKVYLGNVQMRGGGYITVNGETDEDIPTSPTSLYREYRYFLDNETKYPSIKKIREEFGAAFTKMSKPIE